MRDRLDSLLTLCAALALTATLAWVVWGPL